MASTWGPLAFTLVFVTVTVWRTAVVRDLGVALVWLPVAVLLNLPPMTAVWVYLVLLVGLYRLGRRSLSLAAFPRTSAWAWGRSGGWRSPPSGSMGPGSCRSWWSTSPTRLVCC
jgi:hypothetical protein